MISLRLRIIYTVFDQYPFLTVYNLLILLLSGYENEYEQIAFREQRNIFCLTLKLTQYYSLLCLLNGGKET